MTTTTPSKMNSTRRILGDVSPNVKTASSLLITASKQPMAGSPLKRSFTAAVDEGTGFKYLKRRRLSADTPLSQVDGAAEQTRSPVFEDRVQEQQQADTTRCLPLQTTEAETTPSIPAINEPTPTEPGTPPRSPPSPNAHSHPSSDSSSAEHRSFSSLINYDPSSQTSAIPPPQASKAELLRLNLRIAMYKVRTNQVNIPFSHLRLDGPDGVSIASQYAVEEAVAQLRKEAREKMARQKAVEGDVVKERLRLELLPMPVLKPTSYSSRMLYEPLPPSTPPGLDMTRSPERRTRLDEEVLTSSAVKGRVAEGLLGLRHAV